MYQRKTEDIYELRYNYGYGDGEEVIDRCKTRAEAKENQKRYLENEGICPKIIKKRYKRGN